MFAISFWPLKFKFLTAVVLLYPTVLLLHTILILLNCHFYFKHIGLFLFVFPCTAPYILYTRMPINVGHISPVSMLHFYLRSINRLGLKRESQERRSINVLNTQDNIRWGGRFPPTPKLSVISLLQGGGDPLARPPPRKAPLPNPPLPSLTSPENNCNVRGRSRPARRAPLSRAPRSRPAPRPATRLAPQRSFLLRQQQTRTPLFPSHATAPSASPTEEEKQEEKAGKL